MFKKTLLLSILLFAFGCKTTEAPEGWVKMTFDIDENGHPQNIEIVDSKPAEIFDEEAVRALKSWKYKPETIDGKPVVQKGKEVRLDFKLENKN